MLEITVVLVEFDNPPEDTIQSHLSDKDKVEGISV